MKFFLTFYISCLLSATACAQWTAVALAPHASGGGMTLLSDGTVIVKSQAGGGDNIGNLYDRLTPDIHGSYVNGTWTTIAPMVNTRLYYASQLLRDGRVYVAGGEYGTGIAAAEVYNPLNNTWTAAGAPGATVSDANSEILEDGRVLQALVDGNLRGTSIYSLATNAYVGGPQCIGIHNESAWIKLPDNSILFVDRLTRNSERYMPATNTWIADANVPVDLYDPFGLETGGAVLLPDGRALFLGSPSHNAFYTPSGTGAAGVWNAASDFPNGQGAPDAPAAMMVNGIVLCDASPAPTAQDHFPMPTTFYEFNPTTNTFTAIAAPGGGANLNVSTYVTTFLMLPDGNVLYARQGTNQYFIYHPNGGPQNAWRPTINTITLVGSNTYQATGTQFNGISQGATYGDDWQMNTNYPIVRLVSGTNVYYARTSNWNSTGVMRGNAADNVTFTVPATVPSGTYSLFVVANGIESLPFSFTFGCATDVTITGSYSTPITQSSSWIKSSGQTTILNTANVKLDASPTAGYVELKPTTVTDYFLSSPANNNAVFVAQAFDGCSPGIPSRISGPPPIVTTQLINNPTLPPRARLIATKPELTKNRTWQVFPNPARGFLILKSNDIIQDTKFQLLDVNGKSQNITVENIGGFSARIKWNDLSSGIYFLKITSAKEYELVKVLIE